MYCSVVLRLKRTVPRGRDLPTEGYGKVVWSHSKAVNTTEAPFLRDDADSGSPVQPGLHQLRLRFCFRL